MHFRCLYTILCITLLHYSIDGLLTIDAGFSCVVFDATTATTTDVYIGVEVKPFFWPSVKAHLCLHLVDMFGKYKS